MGRARRDCGRGRGTVMSVRLVGLIRQRRETVDGFSLINVAECLRFLFSLFLLLLVLPLPLNTPALFGSPYSQQTEDKAGAGWVEWYDEQNVCAVLCRTEQ